MIERIGTNAGLVWNALNSLGKMDIKALRKATKLRSDKELFAAIGWLARKGSSSLMNLVKNCSLSSPTNATWGAPLPYSHPQAIPSPRRRDSFLSSL